MFRQRSAASLSDRQSFSGPSLSGYGRVIAFHDISSTPELVQLAVLTPLAVTASISSVPLCFSMRSSIERRDGVSFKSLIGKWSQMVMDQVRISVLYTRKVNTENSVDMVFGCIVDGATFLSSDTRFLDSVRIYGREFVSPSFSAPVVTLCRSRFGLHHNSGNRQERNTLSSISDKQLM